MNFGFPIIRAQFLLKIGQFDMDILPITSEYFCISGPAKNNGSYVFPRIAAVLNKLKTSNMYIFFYFDIS